MLKIYPISLNKGNTEINSSTVFSTFVCSYWFWQKKLWKTWEPKYWRIDFQINIGFWFQVLLTAAICTKNGKGKVENVFIGISSRVKVSLIASSCSFFLEWIFLHKVCAIALKLIFFFLSFILYFYWIFSLNVSKIWWKVINWQFFLHTKLWIFVENADLKKELLLAKNRSDVWFWGLTH